MEMEFDTDKQRRQAIRDCVKMLAEAKSLPIFVEATGIRMDDDVKAYGVCVMDKEVWQYLRRSKAKFIGSPFEDCKKEVYVPFSFFDVDTPHMTDIRFSGDDRVSKVYARIGQRIYAVWKQWRAEEWPEIK